VDCSRDQLVRASSGSLRNWGDGKAFRVNCALMTSDWDLLSSKDGYGDSLWDTRAPCRCSINGRDTPRSENSATLSHKPVARGAESQKLQDRRNRAESSYSPEGSSKTLPVFV
jgi:hypothetical protein